VAAAVSWICARRRDEVGDKGAKTTDLFVGLFVGVEGESGGEEKGEMVDAVDGARGLEFEVDFGIWKVFRLPHYDLFEVGSHKGLDAVADQQSRQDCTGGYHSLGVHEL